MSNHVQNLVVTTPPAEEPISLTTAKLHLRVTITNDDPLICALITAARELCEKEVRRAFVTRSYQLRMNRFPWTSPQVYLPTYSDERLPSGTWGLILLPKPPLISVTSLTYQDLNGNVQTLSSGAYQVDAGGVGQGCIAPAYGTYWPQTLYNLDSVLINFQAGFGDASTVPLSICQAMLLTIGHFYRNREATSQAAFTELPLGAKWLLSAWKWGSYG